MYPNPENVKYTVDLKQQGENVVLTFSCYGGKFATDEVLDEIEIHPKMLMDLLQSADAFAESLKLLRDLADLQNGPPLERDRQEFEQTMSEVWKFLDIWEKIQVGLPVNLTENQIAELAQIGSQHLYSGAMEEDRISYGGIIEILKRYEEFRKTEEYASKIAQSQNCFWCGCKPTDKTTCECNCHD